MMVARSNLHGFTLIEVLLSVAIIGLLAGLSLPIYASFTTRNDLDLTTQAVADTLRRAETYARGVSNDVEWGVHIQSGTAILFRGASFVDRNADYDEIVTIPPSMTAGGLNEVVFSKLTAAPKTTGAITLTSPTTGDLRTITINAKGTINY